MNRFAALLDRLSYEPGRNAKLRLLTDYFAHTPDPDRGYALAAMTGALSFANAKPALLRSLIAERVDPTLFALSYDFVGDLAETIALLWPAPAATGEAARLSAIVETLQLVGRQGLARQIADWLDGLDETGRWALLKLITGALRIGVSARLAKTAVAALGGRAPDDIEELWHGLAPPYAALFAWASGQGPRPAGDVMAGFRTPMLAHALDEAELATLDPADFVAEWKWDGIRVQAVIGEDAIARLYSRTGDDISKAFPDLAEALSDHALAGTTLDGELLVMRDGAVQSFNELQQRLNRKAVTAKLSQAYPVSVRVYDILRHRGEDVRALPFRERRTRLEQALGEAGNPRLDSSPQIAFITWDEVARARATPASVGAGADAAAIEGVMLKRRDSPYLPGRPKGHWYKWKRDPHSVDCVLMYAQRGHGKRSSFYSDYTFGVWRAGVDGPELTPVGKAYFGFTDEELRQLDRFVRDNTTERFGPVRAVTPSLVLEIVFDGLARSTRHKSGVAMRFPRVNRIRWDKPAAEADRIETLEAMIA